MTPEDAATLEAAPAAATATKRPMRDDDVLALTWITDPQMSPDGTRIAYVRVEVDRAEDAYRTSLWLVPVAGGTPRALTSGARDAQPRWSPDGTRLAFVRKADAAKPAQLHVLPMDGGEARALTSLEKGASNPAWSPDGRRLAFTSDTHPALDDPKAEKPKHEPARIVTRPMFRENDIGFYDFDHMPHVWVVGADGGDARPLTGGRFSEGAPQWSRDGARVLFTSDRRDEPWFGMEEARVYAVSPELDTPTDGAALELVTDFAAAVAAFAEAPDGRFAMLGAPVPEVAHAYDQASLLLFADARPHRAPKVVHATCAYAWGEGVNSDQHPPRATGPATLAFADGGRALVALAAREGSAMLVRVDLATGVETELTPRGRDAYAASCSVDGGTWAVALGGVDTPGELFALDVASGALTRLDAPNAALLEGLALGDVEELRYPSFDGREVHGWIVKPPGFDAARQYPMVLEIHGGPHSAYGFGFFHEFHVLAGAGNVVVYTNPRGSTSYGWEFANVIQHRFPGDDAKDLLAAVDAVVARGYVDPKRLGVTGGSGGGLLTNWLVAHSDRFAAAVTQRCVTEWASMMATCDFTMFLPHWFKKQPFEDPAEYAALSPYTYVANITTPLMIVHSEDDWRTPIAQGEMLFRALKYLRRTVVMVRFPGENHELSRSGAPSHRVQNQQHIHRWFDRWLHGAATPEYGV